MNTLVKKALGRPGVDSRPEGVFARGIDPEDEAFLQLIRAALQPGDYRLLSADLVKRERDLLLAYDDPLGLTAAFNKNLLVRMNTELGGDFQLDRFGHRAAWNRSASRVEMHLVSLAMQDVRVGRAELRFTLVRDETIWQKARTSTSPKKSRG